MKKNGLLYVLLGGLISALISCNPDRASEWTSIDVLAAMKIENPVRLSDIAERIEYIKLETGPDYLIGVGQVVARGDFLYVRNHQPASLLVFDRQGRFIRQIGRRGKGPGEYTNFAYFDVSGDNRYLAIGGFGGGLMFYTTQGEFLSTSPLNAPFLSGFRFLDPDRLIIYDGRMNENRSGYPVMMAYQPDPISADTLIQVDLVPLETDRPFSLVYSGFYLFNRSIWFMQPCNDTLYELNQKAKVIPRLSFNCGDRRVTEKNLFLSSDPKVIRIYPFGETRNYLFFNAGGLMAYDKKSHEAFRVTRPAGSNDGEPPLLDIENDLEGIPLDFNRVRMDDQTWTTLLDMAEMKAFFGQGGPAPKNRRYYEELRRLVESANENDNPIVRVIYLKQ